jgi:threonine/homoserine/homoserine lactone efflux protein
LPAVISAFIFCAVRWLVIAVVLYTSIMLLRAAKLEKEQSRVGQVVV